MKVAIGVLLAVSMDPYFGNLGDCKCEHRDHTCADASTRYMEMIGNRHDLDADETEIVRQGVETACTDTPWTPEVRECVATMSSDGLSECWPKRGEGTYVFDLVDKASLQLKAKRQSR